MISSPGKNYNKRRKNIFDMRDQDKAGAKAVSMDGDRGTGEPVELTKPKSRQ